jgi:GNAT superfamily N-acetyltransferase
LMMIVRDATREDAIALADVHVRSWQAAYRGLLPDEYLDGLRAEDRAARYSFGSGDARAPQTIVAVDDRLIRGFASIGPSRDEDAGEAGELYALYVDPRRWGGGVGRLLMGRANARLRVLGYAEALLWMLVGNDRAQRFYLLDGWRPDGARRHEDFWGIDADVVRYRRTLA